MTPERWRRLMGVFASALDREEQDRAAFLESACSGDPSLRREVESLLASDEAAERLEWSAFAMEPDSPTLAPGTRLGPYEVVALVGSGGMGEVYRARDERLGREVAVKVLPRAFSRDRQRLMRFEREARAASALNHPGVVTIFDVGSRGDLHYVVSELLEGETLRALLTAGALAVPEALRLAREVVAGLAAAHERGIVHRDLKPENIFVTRDARAKILDFGLAKQLDPRSSRPSMARLGTHPGMVLGTVGYMSPEQVRGTEVDLRSDVFSFGAVLHEMLSGRRAFEGGSAPDLLSAILRDDPPPVSLHNVDVPFALDAVVERCLRKRPEERFADARELGRALEVDGQCRSHSSCLWADKDGSGCVTAEAATPLRGPTRAASVAAHAADRVPGELIMDLLQLEHFLAVAEEGSFTRAAERVCRTQPAVSQSIKKLEETIGSPLFARDVHDIVLTEAGRTLLEFAQRIVRLRDDAVRRISDLRHLDSGQLSIAAHESAAVYLLPGPLRHYLHEYPQIKVGIYRSRLEEIPRQVMDRERDIGFVKEAPAFHELQSVLVHRDEMVLIASPRHRLARRDTVTVRELADEPFVLHNVCAATEERIMRLFQAHGTRCRVAAELWSFENMKHFVRQEVGLSIVPRVTVAQELAAGVLAAVPVEGMQMPRDTYMVFRDPASLSPPARQFLDVVGRFEWDSWFQTERPVADAPVTAEAADATLGTPPERSRRPARRGKARAHGKRLTLARPARARQTR